MIQYPAAGLKMPVKNIARPILPNIGAARAQHAAIFFVCQPGEVDLDSEQSIA